MRPVFATGEVRDRRAGLLLPLLVVALVFCHGFFGGLHLISGSSGAAASAEGGFVGSIAGGHAQHVGSVQGPGEPQDPPSQPGASDYYAAMLVAAVGAAIGLVLRAAPTARGTLEEIVSGDLFAPVAEVPVLARGPDRRALLQVFRL